MPQGASELDFDAYHRDELAGLIAAGRGPLAAPAAERLGPLAFRIAETGAAYTYTPERGSVRLRPGSDDARTVVELEQRYWQGLGRDLESAPGLIYGGYAKGLRGDLMDFVRWEPSLRALYRGRPVYDSEHVDLRGRDGVPLDPSRSFAWGDDAEEMADQLRVMGYLRVRGVFGDDEVAAMLDDAEALRAAAVPDDQKSWWGKRADGSAILVRVIHAGARERLRRLYEDERIRRLATLPDESLVARGAGKVNGATVLWKQPGVAEGLGDLPWHRDCGMGGHAVMCPAVNCSIHLGPATPDSGDLRFLPGSWRYSVGFADGDDASAARGVSLDAEPGDVSLHYGDVVHAAPPPQSESGPFRTSVLIGFSRPEFEHHRGEAHYNDALFQDDESVPDMLTMARRATDPSA